METLCILCELIVSVFEALWWYNAAQELLKLIFECAFLTDRYGLGHSLTEHANFAIHANNRTLQPVCRSRIFACRFVSWWARLRQYGLRSLIDVSFLPRCIKCRRGLAMRILSVCLCVGLSVCLPHAWSLTKWKKDRSRFLYRTKEHLS